ncbi:hypothetical protein [Legionella maioricensis]|uniref:Uncharacterized protein n=1 Tax=Legionella maioricensis TaxID=2896528 RepID=A0A9X2ID74_9GAMM|nr:hypothetical protein [Legionella maioricensis]MCL9684473.1 hypothetical protein [Legionella maioricensis]MCL9688824.1 hypothetical protein [Legionella maioricensis]
MDNISVAIQTLTQDTPPFLLGMYDGQDASCHAAKNIGRVFKEQCALPPVTYAAQDLSVNCLFYFFDIYYKQADQLTMQIEPTSNKNIISKTRYL